MPHVSFEHVSYSYVDNDEQFQALEDINLEIHDGELLCLVGHSGCGKSTMLSLLAGLTMPTDGRILIEGKPVQGPGPDRSIVFQNYSLFPWQTALRNVSFALQQTGGEISRQDANEQARELLKQVGVLEAANRFPFQLSGGMRQRVAIARALAIDAPVMLLDEPFGALDPLIRRKLQELMLELWKGECCKTALFVTHDIDEALILADRIAFMEPKHIVKIFELPKDRERTLDAIYNNPELLRIKTEVLASFERSMSMSGGEE